MMNIGVYLKYAIVIAACTLLYCSKAILGSDWQLASATLYGKLQGARSEGNSNKEICNIY